MAITSILSLQSTPNFDWWCRIIILKNSTKNFRKFWMTSLSTGKIWNTSKIADVIKIFWIFLIKFFRIVNLHHQSKFGVDRIDRIEIIAVFDNDGFETVFVTCFFDGFQNVKISFWPIFWDRLILNFWPSTFRNPLY